MTLDIFKLRAETPGCQNVLHFNNAGASLTPAVVIQAVREHLDLEYAIGGYEAADYHYQKSEAFYQNAAKLINANADEIAFLENATRAWDMAFYSLNLQKGDRILTAMCEYASNYLTFLYLANKKGIIIDVVPNDAFGQLDTKQLQNKINKDVKLIAITHIPTQGGLVNPAKEIGLIAKQNNIPYLLDTTQSVGQMPIDVKDIHCDFLCATGRKYLRGPRGTGFLYAKKEIIEKSDLPFIDLHAATWIANNQYQIRNDAKRFETWEQNIAAKIGLSTSIEYALDLGVENIWDRIQVLANYLRESLSQIPGVNLQDLGKIKCGIITFTAKGKSAHEIKEKLNKEKINVSISLQEYARLDLGERNIDALIRASVHYYNTEEEVDIFCSKLRGICQHA